MGLNLSEKESTALDRLLNWFAISGKNHSQIMPSCYTLFFEADLGPDQNPIRLESTGSGYAYSSFQSSVPDKDGFVIGLNKPVSRVFLLRVKKGLFHGGVWHRSLKSWRAISEDWESVCWYYHGTILQIISQVEKGEEEFWKLCLEEAIREGL